MDSVRVLEMTAPQVLEGSIGTCPYPLAHTEPTMHIIFLL